MNTKNKVKKHFEKNNPENDIKKNRNDERQVERMFIQSDKYKLHSSKLINIIKVLSFSYSHLIIDLDFEMSIEDRLLFFFINYIYYYRTNFSVLNNFLFFIYLYMYHCYLFVIFTLIMFF